ncbi:hypothetical protein [Salinibacillus xinjiangensis]|uniref:Uncharacterized protein n=1 Tax=Salinibacillus xinjiangensis TaxID=1229268 RepID=A0A6G1X9E3_9BACI|nr:hypothetical protein [Salinibacillus xinjiangensis]MRG87594.1 hypothetical protein [Salinibacillus xinjiangensis]
MRIRTALLSIVMPGLGQLFNRQYIKSITFLIIEHSINRLSHLNQALYLDMNGLHKEALSVVNYEFAMFYPGFYVLVVLDAVMNTKETKDTKFIYWFILSGLLGTVGIIYSRFIPIPVFTVGFSMAVLMLIGTIHCSKNN